MTTTRTVEPGALVKPGRQRQLLTFSLMLAMGVAALEGTVVTTALPTIVGELHGLTLYPWVFAAYLLTSTTSVPIYGKLADLYGRKPVFMVGLALFLLGTALSGLSASMTQLIVFRAVQGLGAGAVLPLTFTVLGDIYTIRERAKVQPLFSSIWGVLSIAGPPFGALITATLSWRWVFFVNVPVCIATSLLLWAFLRERVDRRRVSVDYLGALTLTLGLVAALLAVLEGGKAWPWSAWQSLGLFGAAALLLVAFSVVERRVPDPMIPFRAFRIGAVAVSSVGNLLVGVCMFGLMSFVPLYAQGVQGQGAGGASAVLIPMLLGWSMMALGSGKLFVTLGFRLSSLIGTALIAAGTAPLILVTPASPLLLIGACMAVAGFGFGLSSTSFILAPQAAVPWGLRGAITSSTQFFRTIGGAVGVSLLGAVLNAQLTARVPAEQLTQDLDTLVSSLLNPESRAALPADLAANLSLGMADGLHLIYLAVFAIAAVGLLQVAFFAQGPEPAIVQHEASEPTGVEMVH
jgi:EmrB/QacA subfamily drug resistance transporter